MKKLYCFNCFLNNFKPNRLVFQEKAPETAKVPPSAAEQNLEQKAAGYIYGAIKRCDDVKCKFEPITKLTINPQYDSNQNEQSHYYLKKDKTDGEADLYEFTETADIEENWLFVNYINNEQLWYENGSNEHREKTEHSLRPMKYIVQRENEVKELAEYHFHIAEKDNQGDSSQLISEKDLYAALETAIVISKNNPALLDKFEYRIVTSSGIYILKPNPKIITGTDEKFDKAFKELTDKVDKLKQGLGEAARIKYNNDLTGHPTYNFLHSNKTNWAKESARFAKDLSTSLMQISFMPR